ncbi:MAG TPA: adenylate/guanylate cyclase domain-containing protein [Bacteroidales bacterium]|nr:adenylate/guanylate cyclase domain-containing protein [Bacteroidales bacterium]
MKYPGYKHLMVFLFALVSQLTLAGVENAGINKIIINGSREIEIPAGTAEREAFFARDIELKRSENSVAFVFDEGENADFSYFLNGFDQDWIERGTSGFKEYTNLPAGKYVFHARIKKGNTENTAIVRLHILPFWYLSFTALVIYSMLVVMLLWVIYEQIHLNFARKQYMLEQIINKRTEDLIIEKEKSEALLANVLPRNTATEIMAKGKATKIKYNFVTVLFSDIQGFTKIAEEMNPEVLIDELDKFFFHFDSVVEKYGIEKIKTIGDAYMCAGGIPEKNRTNPVEVILAALEMKAYMTKLKRASELQGMEHWDIRIGIHTGTVVAGVVGQKKLSYDIWGDTVNTASRMESSGEAGKINISGTTYEFVKEFFVCEYRGKMPVKYKGELEMYFVKGIVQGLCDEEGMPNNNFFTKIKIIKLLDIEEAIIKLFDEEASPNLYFHNSSMVKNITNHVELLSTSEKLSDEEFILLKIAAIFLYAGYIYNYESPFESSIRIAGELLPKYGFSRTETEAACLLITNSYNNIIDSLSDKILHDARYDYLGRVDYLKLTEKLLRERTEYGRPADLKNWNQIQITMLKEHEFQTQTARLLRSVPAEEQILNLEKI